MRCGPAHGQPAEYDEITPCDSPFFHEEKAEEWLIIEANPWLATSNALLSRGGELIS